MDTVDVMDEVGTGELQQQQQLINNLGQIEVSQDKRIQDLEKQNSLIRGKLREYGL
ncbi:20119_t:CDS:2 [Rhizophagus irregularis]|nr:20119_t:CDS:2 [Rhizophagus irregularis]